MKHEKIEDGQELVNFETWFNSLSMDDRYDFDISGAGFRKDPVKMMRLAYEAGKANATSQEAAPTGWQLVPIEPTAEMMNVYKEWHRANKGFMDISVYKAMLKAAPKP